MRNDNVNNGGGGSAASGAGIDHLVRDMTDERTERRKLALEMQNNVADTQELRGILETTNERLQLLAQEMNALNANSNGADDRRTGGAPPKSSRRRSPVSAGKSGWMPGW